MIISFDLDTLLQCASPETLEIVETVSPWIHTSKITLDNTHKVDREYTNEEIHPLSVSCVPSSAFSSDFRHKSPN